MDIKETIALKVPAAARATGLGMTSLYGAMQAGELAFVKVGAARLILREDLETWLKQHRVPEAA